jgi:hypothetical protein
MKSGRFTNHKNMERDILTAENFRSSQLYLFHGGMQVLNKNEPNNVDYIVGNEIINTVGDSTLKKIFMDEDGDAINIDTSYDLTTIPKAYNRKERVVKINKLKVLNSYKYQQLDLIMYMII